VTALYLQRFGLMHHPSQQWAAAFSARAVECAKLKGVGTRYAGWVSNEYMRYWGYLIAKLAVAGAFLLELRKAVAWMFHPQRFAIDLAFTFAMMVVSLIAAGLLWVIVLDQRYRCRTCLRRLRMPVATGSWTHILFIGIPRTEYICPYGHGTLKVAELQITGRENPDWQPHDDIWKELNPDLSRGARSLYSLADTKK